MKRKTWLLSGVAAALAGAFAVASWGGAARVSPRSIVVDSLLVDAPGTCGELLVSYFDGSETGSSDVHRTVLMNGPEYRGMEDNDLRGFPDGGVRWGWNQPGQIHVRVGRKNRTSGYGEPELFRIIQKWEGVPLPPDPLVTAASLVMVFERVPTFRGRLLLYEVRRDWNPGAGGVNGDNNSPPNPGEVWWNYAAHGERAWALPGLGYADHSDPDADTDLFPLAEAVFSPGDTTITFASAELARYVGTRVSDDQPLLFLIKVSDQLEDVPGSRLFFYSGNEGVLRTLARRPRLELSWQASGGRSEIRLPVRLERGRSLTLSGFAASPGGWLASSWSSGDGCIPPTISIREPGGVWSPTALPVRIDWDSVEVRITAGQDPVPLGTSFTAEMRDTWVETAAPEDQEVRWTFISPSGVRHDRLASYRGDFVWSIRFAPDEPGTWRYFWSQSFLAEPFRSAEGAFEVVTEDIGAVLSALAQLEEQISSQPERSTAELLRRFSVRFNRLERTGVGLIGALGMDSPDGRALRDRLNRIRSIIAGNPVPDHPMPLEAIPPHPWRDDNQ